MSGRHQEVMLPRVRLLRRGPFALLVVGSALNAIGTWATLIALWGYAAYRFHVGPGAIALVGLAWSAPAALLGPFAGIPIDRLGPKRLLVASNVGGVVASLAMAAAGRFSTLVVFAVGAGVVQAFGRPAAMSLPPRLVGDEDLLAANALLGAAEQSAIVFGPLAGAAVTGLWGVRAPFLFDAVTFVVGAAAVLPVALRPVVATPRSPVARELAEGWRVAMAVAEVRLALALAAAVFVSWGAFFVLEPLYVRDVLHRSPVVLGLFQTVFGVGLIGATLLLPRVGDRVASVRVLAVSVAVSGLTAAAYVGTRSIVVAAVAVFLWGVDVAFFMPPMRTLLQRATPVEAHGRVLGTASMLAAWGNLLGIPLTGVLVAALGVSATGATVGTFAVAAGIVGWLASRARDGGPPRRGRAAETLAA
jgi:predicted MFS family arabinose efflux permease